MPLIVFDIDDPDTHTALYDLSESLQATIEQSPEWKSHASKGTQSPAAAPSPLAASMADLEDDIPF
jgi:hypothetical protein